MSQQASDEPPAAPETPQTRDRAALWRPIREAVTALAAGDPKRARFGAAAHQYALRPVLTDLRIAELEAAAGVRLPDDYRDFLLEVGDGGAGPGYGLVPFDQAEQQALMEGVFAPHGIEPLEVPKERAPSEPGVASEPIPESATATGSGPTTASSSASSTTGQRVSLLLPWHGVVLLSHLGCGYLAYLVLEGPHRGQVWMDLGSNGPAARIAPHFIAFYTDWLSAAQRNEWPATHVQPGSCALALALSGYLGHIERQLGREAGALSDTELRGALASLGPGAIQIAAETKSSPAIAAASPIVDPCLVCERMLLELSNLGLQRAAIAPGAAVGFPAPE